MTSRSEETMGFVVLPLQTERLSALCGTGACFSFTSLFCSCSRLAASMFAACEGEPHSARRSSARLLAPPLCAARICNGLAAARPLARAPTDTPTPAPPGCVRVYGRRARWSSSTGSRCFGRDSRQPGGMSLLAALDTCIASLRLRKEPRAGTALEKCAW